ncbi:GNAT family N-acetyltransferase [Actinomycetospora sp. OC33-EN08]|uniref:GNAT family N-acetyltransferase n=1 Tax=Actinomycetospora aurantiaca TaxID=3129233 RepID=A0ABU8MIA8_9PSEU
MTEWTWTAEPTPVWDADKADAFSPAGPGLHGLGSPADGDALGDAWWRVSADDGSVAAFGRLDDTWGDAEVLVAVVPAFRGRGVGSWAMNRLTDEAAARQLNYVYNVVPENHPDREGVAAWLAAQGFDARDTGELRRRVRVTERAGGAHSPS